MRVLKRNIMKSGASVGIIIPTAARHNFSPFLAKMEKELLKTGKYPSFFIVKGGKFEKGFCSSHQGAVENLTFIEGEDAIGKRVISGFNAAHKQNNDQLIFTCDDFDHLIGSFSKFSRLLGNQNEMRVGAWELGSHTYLPYPLFINELSMTFAVTYANPAHPASSKPPTPNLDSYLQFKIDAKKHKSWHQVYFGLMGLVSKRWVELRDALPEIFKENNQWQHVGLEAGLVLVAHHLGIDVKQLELPKRFEHSLLDKKALDYPQQNKNYLQGRIVHFKSGISLVESYTGIYAPRKTKAIQKLKDETIEILKNSDFYWAGGIWPRASEWNTPIRTAL